MSSLQISSSQIQLSQVVDSVTSYHVQMSIKTFIAICLTIMLSLFISCLILVHKSYKKIETDKKDNTMKEEKNNLIEEELKNIKLIINLLQDEFLNKITEIENKNNIMSEQILRIKFIKDKKETQLEEQDKNNLLIDEYKNLKDEINVLTHKFTYYNSKQDDNLNLLTEDLRKINKKVDQQQQINQEKNNLLEENIRKITNKVEQQKQIIENNKNQSMRFNSFLNNFTIRTYVRGISYNVRLNGSTLIPFNMICSGIGTSILRMSYSIENNFIIKHDNNKIIISQHLNELTTRNIFIEIPIIDDDKTNDVNNPYSSYQIPLYMICLLFGTKIITFNDEDVTDLFEINFNSVKKYHEKYYYCMKENEYCHNKVIESKRILDMCNIDVVREMFK